MTYPTNNINICPNPNLDDFFKNDVNLMFVDEKTELPEISAVVIFLMQDFDLTATLKVTNDLKSFGISLETKLHSQLTTLGFTAKFGAVNCSTFCLEGGSEKIVYAVGMGDGYLDEHKSLVLGHKLIKAFGDSVLSEVLIILKETPVNAVCFLTSTLKNCYGSIKHIYKATASLPFIKNLYVHHERYPVGLKSTHMEKTINNYASGAHLAASLAELPSNICTTTYLLSIAKALSEKYGLSLTVLEADELIKYGYLSCHAVGRGSENPPRIIHLEYGSDSAPQKIALLGKGITFDSGGYNLKVGPYCQIEKMKYDMAGFAAVLGAAYIIGNEKPKNLSVMFVSAVAENLISSSAYRPGDIISAANGRTIEVLNTDAEGRLTLADGLCYCESQGADIILDVATLTGAAVQATSDLIAPMYTKDDELAMRISSAAQKTGELIWRMPLLDELRSRMDSTVADIANVTTKGGGGSITAALFLTEFVSNAKHIHMDIAGPVYVEEYGFQGYGARTLAKFVTDYE